VSQPELYNNLELWAVGQIARELAKQEEMAITTQVIKLAEAHGLCGSNGEVAKQLADMGYVIVRQEHYGPTAMVERDGKVQITIERPTPVLRQLTEQERAAFQRTPCSHGLMDCFQCWWKDGRPARE